MGIVSVPGQACFPGPTDATCCFAENERGLIVKIAVIGAGAMGSMLGACLKMGGADVTLVERNPELAKRLADPGLLIRHYTDDPDSAASLPPVPMKTCTDAQGLGEMDLVLFMVKGPDTRAALSSAMPLFGEKTWALTLQNGVGNVDILAEALPKERILYGCLNMSAIMEEPAVVTGNLFGKVNVYLGAVVKEEAQRQFGEVLAAVFSAGGAPAAYIDEIDREVWSKMLVNIAVNASCGLVRLRGGEAGEDQQFVMLAVDMIKETIAVAHALGIELDFGKFMTRTLPAARKTSGAHYPSMAQDMMMYQAPTEIDFLNGAVERLGNELGVPTPVNTTVSRLVRVIEHNYARQYVPSGKSGKAAPAFRIRISEKFCKGCGYCVKYCEKQVLCLSEERSDKGFHIAQAAAPENCTGCLNCAVVCPEAAISIAKEG